MLYWAMLNVSTMPLFLGILLFIRYWAVKRNWLTLCRASEVLVLVALVGWSAGTANIIQTQLDVLLGYGVLAIWVSGGANGLCGAFGALLATVLNGFSSIRLLVTSISLMLTGILAMGVSVAVIHVH